MENHQNSPNESQGKDNKNINCKPINPEFDDLGRPETYFDHLQELRQQAEEEAQEGANPFPVEVFPKPIQDIIWATNESLNYPIDFIGASLLFAISVAIGNTHWVELMKGYAQNAVLYLALVGRAGTNKSHPLSFALAPTEERDSLKFQEFLHNKSEFEEISVLPKKEREEQGRDEPMAPFWEQLLVTDFTPEALTEIHKNNKRGLGVYCDEIAAWFKNFDRYNKGSEEQFWLSVWSGKPIRINRKTSEPTFIPLPFISVAGTIQPGILHELAKNRTENGFLDRLLFVMPENLKKEYWSETELDQAYVEDWKSIVTNLLNLDLGQDENFNPKPAILKFTSDAKKLLFEWQREITDLSNGAQSDAVRGIYAKIEQYAIRLALCLEMARYACNEGRKQSVGIESVRGAIKLVEYFKNTAIKVQTIVSSTCPLDRLSTDKQKLYSELLETFTTSEGLAIAEKLGMAERTFKTFIKNRELFARPKHGHYEKLL